MKHFSWRTAGVSLVGPKTIHYMVSFSLDLNSWGLCCVILLINLENCGFLSFDNVTFHYIVEFVGLIHVMSCILVFLGASFLVYMLVIVH